MDALTSPPSSPIATVTTILTAGQTPLVYRLTMLREAVAYIAFAILWLFGYARTFLQFFLSLLLKPVLPFLTSRSARRINRPRTTQASRGERAHNAHIHSKTSSHSRNPSVTPIPSVAGQFPLKSRSQPTWVMHKPISSASSTSSQETKHRRSTSMTRSCASAPVTPLKSSIPLDFSDGEEYFPRVAGPFSQKPSSTSLRPLTHTDNESEPRRARARGIKDHSSRRILFNHALHNPASNTRPAPSPVTTLDSPPCLLDIEPARAQANMEPTAIVFTAEPEEILNLDNTVSFTAPRVRKLTSWKSKLFSKPRMASTEQTAANAEVSLMTSTPNMPTLWSTKEKENGFLRMFGTNKRHTPATVGSSEQSITAAANEAELTDPKKKGAIIKFGKKASRKGIADVAPPPRACTLSDSHLPSPCSEKVSLKHAATFGHCSSTDAPSTSQPPPPPAPSRQQQPKELRNGPGHSGMHTFLHPIQACQAHLYNVHGIGSGPSTLDLMTPTPIPKGGVKRTDPYAELGIARVPAVNVIAARRASAPSTVEVKGVHNVRTPSDL